MLLQLPAWRTDEKAEMPEIEPVFTWTWKVSPTRLYWSNLVKPRALSAFNTGTSSSQSMCEYWLITYCSCLVSKAVCTAWQILPNAARLVASERTRFGYGSKVVSSAWKLEAGTPVTCTAQFNMSALVSLALRDT